MRTYEMAGSHFFIIFAHDTNARIRLTLCVTPFRKFLVRAGTGSGARRIGSSAGRLAFYSFLRCAETFAERNRLRHISFYTNSHTVIRDDARRL
jgi:hypothetical protein